MTGLELTQLAIDNADRIRRDRGQTIADLARSAGITRQYFSLLRSVNAGKRVISLHVLACLARALEVPPATLLKEPTPMNFPVKIWTIYGRTAHHPHHYAVRGRELEGREYRDTGECGLFPSLEDARESCVQRGLICIPRPEGDPSTVVEFWL